MSKVMTHHRIDIEYISILKVSNKKEIFQRLIQGLKRNAKLSTRGFVWEEQLYSQLDIIASRIALQTSEFLRNTQALYQIRYQQENERLANVLLVKALNSDIDEAKRLVQRSIELLKQVLEKNPNHYHAHFNIAWMSLNYLNDFDQAEQYFIQAIQLAPTKHHLFEVFAMRHLAKTRYQKQDYVGAESIMCEVLNSTLQPDPEYQYEYARYLVATGEVSLSSLYLGQAIEKLPIYYTQATVEPDFQDKGIISQLLDTYKEQSLNYIRQTIQKTWESSELSRLQLPEELSIEQVLQEACHKHEKEIRKQPFVIVKKNQKQVESQLIKSSKEALLTELIDKETYYLKKIGIKKSKWKLINKSGGFLIHAASVLLLATVFVMSAKLMLVSIGLGSFFYFDEVAGRTFFIVLILGVLGAYLLRSQPLGVKKLFKKRLMFRDALTLVHKM